MSLSQRKHQHRYKHPLCFTAGVTPLVPAPALPALPPAAGLKILHQYTSPNLPGAKLSSAALIAPLRLIFTSTGFNVESTPTQHKDDS